MMRAAALLALLFPSASAAQVQRFPLHKPYFEQQVVACTDQAIAERILHAAVARATKEGSALLLDAARRRICIYLSGEVVYKRQTLRVDHGDAIFTVYECLGEDGRTYFVLLAGWLHEGVES